MKLAAVLALMAVCFAPQQPAAVDAASTGSIATADRVEGLTEAARIVIATNYILNLEPGVVASKQNDAYSLSTYDGKAVRFQAGADSFALPSPVMARLTSTGWDLGTGKTYASASLVAAQDDTDSNLKSMQESAKKLKAKSSTPGKQGPKKGSMRFLFGSSNPMATAEAFSSVAIQQLTHISAIGF